MTQQGTDLIARLRLLRTDERRLRETLVNDLQPFQKPDDLSFFTLPDSNRTGISVATTCTALMALIDSDKLTALFRKPQEKPEKTKQRARNLFRSVVKATWKSSGLRDLNAFTTCMVVRAAGFVTKAKLFTSAEVQQLNHELDQEVKQGKGLPQKQGAIEKDLREKEGIDRTLSEIAETVARCAESSFSVPGYPAKTTMAYWFVDGITRAEIEIGADHWKRIAEWASKQFNRELSYVVSGNDALMDIASLAMAACLVSRIRKACAEREALIAISETLPSGVELRQAILQVFENQTPSGIWHRHFPLFHFPGSGAADYCFSFEFLEATLIEFSHDDVLLNPRILEHVSKAVLWCENNRLEYGAGGNKFRGWNAGGDVTKLVAGMPEAWATGAVHMFLAELDSAVSALLDKLALKRFLLDREVVGRSDDKWEELIDVNLTFPGEKLTTLKTVLEEELFKNEDLKSSPKMLRERALTGPRSALLFGPPGTSKTSIAKAVAKRLGWPLIVLTPSEFLSNGLEQIYVRVHEIFEDLMDISAAVVLFDEMDALAQTRGKEQGDIDVTRQLLTTSMLPKLANLWNQGRVIFFMATNHKQQLDAAITRPGRFDLLLCIGPPTWEKKLAGLAVVMKGSSEADLTVVQENLKSLCKSKDTQKGLDMFTVAELRSLLQHVRRRKNAKNLQAALERQEKKEFESIVKEWATTTIALSRKSALEKEYKTDVRASRRQ
jgi:hypothetical protein